MAQSSSLPHAACVLLSLALLHPAVPTLADEEGGGGPSTASVAGEPGIYLVGPGDELSVVIIGGAGVTAVTQTLTIAGDGTIDVAHVGPVKVSGLATSDIRQRIRSILVSREIFKQPTVSVNVTGYHSQGVNVSGFVDKPQRIFLRGPTRLLDAISICGGVDEKDAGAAVQITRPGLERPLTVRLRDLFSTNVEVARAANIYVQAGDNVHVPGKALFCIVGPVEKSGCYPIEDGMTLLQAISVAGGLDEEEADRHDVVIRRQGEGGLREIRVDLDSLGAASLPPPVEADDQIVVGVRKITRFCVRGPVDKPDCYEMEKQPTLGEAIAKAGGLNLEKADGRSIDVHRKVAGKLEKIHCDLGDPGPEGQLFLVEHDDEIAVGEAQLTFSVDGEVAKPGNYPWRPGMTISDAIAEAGGAQTATVLGALERVTLRRGGQSSEVNVKAIQRGKGEDVPVKAGDRIHVPRRRW
jgi:polysaccharide export outer membrane protein